VLLDEFDFDLPQGLIAQTPLSNRADARLLFVDMENRRFEDYYVRDLSAFLRPGDLVVLNDTKVIPARLFGKKASGGAVELLVERILSKEQVLVKIKSNRSPKIKDQIDVIPFGALIVTARNEPFYTLSCHPDYDLEDIFKCSGHVPLPPYIKRVDTINDIERYQTLFARDPGAVAAPTAGLHITKNFLRNCKKKLIDVGHLTLHIGSGTYTPIRSSNIYGHRMHGEQMVINSELCDQVNRVKSTGGRVFAVGTTVLRALETVARTTGQIRPFSGETTIFIRPGFCFNVVDYLLTNFHMPKSSLFVLLGAFAGLKRIQGAYRYAIEEGYRFYSYGDAMLVSKSRATK